MPLFFSVRARSLAMVLLIAGWPAMLGCGGGDERGDLGKSCLGGESCGGGLSCETSSPLDGLCTVTCASSDECIEQFGFGSFCIGAERCVRECVDDDDCLDGTVCGEFRWCRN